MIELTSFEGHLVLWAKNQYKVGGVDLITSIKRIWAARCGISIHTIDNGILPIIANFLYKLVLKTDPSFSVIHLQENLHSEIECPTYYLKDCSAIELIILFYRNRLVSLKIKENEKFLVKLPEPNNEFFEKVISGNYENKFDDYKLLEQ